MKESVLKQKWYYRFAVVLFWASQLLIVVAGIYQGLGVSDLIIGFAVYTLIMMAIWKVIIYISFGKIEKDNK